MKEDKQRQTEKKRIRLTRRAVLKAGGATVLTAALGCNGNIEGNGPDPGCAPDAYSDTYCDTY